MDLKVPVIGVAQLNRNVEQRGGEPMLSDLRESGAIEQDADVVMFIYRDDYYNQNSEKPGTAQINILKNRGGMVGEFDLVFKAACTNFIDMEEEREGE